MEGLYLKVSVAMATYNGALYIEKQLHSILSQSHRPDEIIIVDDCSTDNTLKIVRRIAAQASVDISIFENTVNLGYRKNFRRALKMTTGEFVFLSDQDDYWETNKIQDVISKMQTMDCELIATSFDLIDGQDAKILNFDQFKSDPLLGYENQTNQVFAVDLKRLIWGNFLPGCTYCIRRSVINRYLQIGNDTLPHDYQLFLLAANHKAAYWVDSPLMSYRLHSNNTIGVNNNKVNQGSRTLKPNLISFFEQIKETEPLNLEGVYLWILYFRIPALRFSLIKKFGLNNHMHL